MYVSSAKPPGKKRRNLRRHRSADAGSGLLARMDWRPRPFRRQSVPVFDSRVATFGLPIDSTSYEAAIRPKGRAASLTPVLGVGFARLDLDGLGRTGADGAERSILPEQSRHVPLALADALHLDGDGVHPLLEASQPFGQLGGKLRD